MANPFLSKTFIDIWSKYFNNAIVGLKFETFNKVLFYKFKFFPIYVNIGQNLTKGVDYEINYEAKDYKNKVFLIYDVPEYFKLPSFDSSKTKMNFKSLYQYNGFLMDFNKFSNSDEYIKSRKSNNLRGLKSKKKRLENCFDISYHFYNSEMDSEVYDLLFDQFHDLLFKRFDSKNVNYHHLNADKWIFHKDFTYEMLKQNKASLFVIYNEKKPISITLNIHSEDTIINVITVFDTDYYKFSVGKLSNTKIIEWCFENNMKYFDLSKGDFKFKHEWCNVTYNFDYHLFYDSNSLIAKLLAWLTASFFKFKLYLRNHNANSYYRRLLFKIKIKKYNNNYDKFDVEDYDQFTLDNNHVEININDEKYYFIKSFVFSFLFANPEPINNIKVYTNENSKTFNIVGSLKAQRITFK